MTVLILSPFFSPNVGGVEAHLNKLISCLRKRDIKVIVLTYQPLTTPVKGLPVEKRDGVEIRRINWFGIGLFHKLEPYPIIELLYLIPGLLINCIGFFLTRRNEIDVIHAHGFVCSLITRLLKPIHRKRMVVSTHAIYHLEDRFLMRTFVRWILKPFDKILAVGTPSKKELIAIGLDKNKIDIHPNWIDLDAIKPFDSQMMRKELNLPEGFIVLFLSRMIDKKGVTVLLEAAKQLSPSISWVFVGDGPMAPVIQEEAKEHKNIIFVGRIPNNESDKIPKYYSAASLFALPSQYEEGFAGAPLEALACGTPVLGSNKGCFPVDILDETVGVMVEPDVSHVPAAIKDLYAHQDKFANLRKNCREYALRKFSEKNVEVIVAGYHKES